MITKYSAVIIAKNEERTIGKCITALKDVTDDIIIVLDDNTTDKTGHIAKDLGAKIFTHKWNGYSATKNYGVTKASHDWIICVDADEILDEKLINHLKILSPSDSSAYLMNRQTYFGDYAVSYCGWHPDWVIRLYHKKWMKWNNSEVHEKLESDRPVKNERLTGLLFHYSFETEEEMMNKFDRYARLRANEWKIKGKKPSLIKKTLGPYFRFLRTYILKLGFLDGRVGLMISKNEFELKKKELAYFKALQNH